MEILYIDDAVLAKANYYFVYVENWVIASIITQLFLKHFSAGGTCQDQVLSVVSVSQSFVFNLGHCSGYKKVNTSSINVSIGKLSIMITMPGAIVASTHTHTLTHGPRSEILEDLLENIAQHLPRQNNYYTCIRFIHV